MMKRKVIIALIYLSGVVASYNVGKSAIQRKYTHWTIGDRAAVMVASLFSWGSVVGCFVVMGIPGVNAGSPAKW